MFLFQSEVHYRLRSHTTEKYNFEPSKYWNDFYKSKANFFRDRKWLPREFPELLGLTESDVGSTWVNFVAVVFVLILDTLGWGAYHRRSRLWGRERGISDPFFQ